MKDDTDETYEVKFLFHHRVCYFKRKKKTRLLICYFFAVRKFIKKKKNRISDIVEESISKATENVSPRPSVSLILSITTTCARVCCVRRSPQQICEANHEGKRRGKEDKTRSGLSATIVSLPTPQLDIAFPVHRPASRRTFDNRPKLFATSFIRLAFLLSPRSY